MLYLWVQCVISVSSIALCRYKWFYLCLIVFLVCIAERLFYYNGSVIWNNLPDEIRMATDVLDFKWRYKCLILNHLFENGRCPFACKLTENSVYFIRHFIPMSKVGLFTCVSFKLFVILLYHVPDQMKLCNRAAWESSCITECYYPVWIYLK